MVHNPSPYSSFSMRTIQYDAYMFYQFSLAIKTAYRNFLKNRIYGTINMLGLALAFVTTILVACYLNEELSYEDFHLQADRIYRPTHLIQGQNDFELHFARVPVDFVNELPAEIPEIEKLIRFQNKEQKYIRVGEKRFKPHHAYVTDADVFDVFTFPMLEGSPATALKNPQSVVLTKSIAKKYFGHTNVVGEEIYVIGDWSSEEQAFQVTGIIEDVPPNTHLPVEMFFSFANVEERTGWAYIYTLFSRGAEMDQVEKKVSALIAQRTDANAPNQISFVFQPLPSIHLHSNLAREIQPNGQVIYLKIFFWVGLFVWLIALINFGNLGAALAISRGKEIGVRKVLGASKRQVLSFSLVESMFQSFAAMGIGLLISLLVFPLYSRLTGITLIPDPMVSIVSLSLLAILTGLLAGILPAFVLSSLKILQIMRQGGQWSMRQRGVGINLKRGMVTLQFVATVLLMGSALIAYQQFRFIEKRNLGIKSEQILTIAEVPSEVTQKYRTLKTRLQEIPGVKGVTGCMQLPSSEIRDVGPVLVKGADQAQPPMMDMQVIDPDFMKILELELLAGQDFTENEPIKPYPELREDYTLVDYLSQTPRKYFINETGMRQLGWNDPQQALGQEVNWSIGNWSLAHGPITGVIKDYHQESLKNKVDPLLLTTEPLWWSNVLIQLDAKHIESAVSAIEAVWNNMFPYAFDYSFLDDQFAQLYATDRVQLKLLSGLTLIAVAISFLGLMGLVAYALRTRAKELAIRRVIGADLKSLAVLIGREYFWVVVIASCIGVPLSYHWVARWLENFAYHIQISPSSYIVAVGSLFGLLAITIFWQTRKATVTNPMLALKED